MKKYMQTSPPPSVLSRLQSVNLMVAKVNVCHLLCNFFPPLILYVFLQLLIFCIFSVIDILGINITL